MRRAYLDTNMVIYFVEHHPQFFPLLYQRLVNDAGQPQVAFVSSDLVRMETRVLPLRTQNQALLTKYEDFFNLAEMSNTPFGHTLFDLATDLRANHNLKTPDALHLAAAIAAGCDEFWTNDGRLAKAAQGRIANITLGNT
jgi:predicted nucleic acid-binding protein